MSETPKSHGRKTIRPSLKPRELMTDRPALARAWTAQVITLFPEAFPGVLGLSLTGKALQDGIWQLDAVNLREFGEGKHRNVDDTPAGGGAGMVLRPDVMGRALETARRKIPGAAPIIYLSPRGRRFDQPMARRLAQAPGVTLICGRFEGLDQRVLDHYGVTEVSLGDYVLTGGELAAQAMLDATVRLLPGVLGNASSIEEESFSARAARASAIHPPRRMAGPRDPAGAAFGPSRRDREVAPAAIGRDHPGPAPRPLGGA